MKKIISIILLFTLIFSGTEVYAFQNLDLTTKSELSADELRNGLRGELKNYAEDFIEAEETYGVNALFLAAISAWESGWGKSCFRPNNIFGWSGKSFDSKEECIDFVASKIAEHYLSENGKYYRGKTVAAVNRCYNGTELWERKIVGIMWMIAKRSYETQEEIIH